MNALTNLNNTNTTLTMSSREIAELTGKQHKHVLEDIRKMLEALEIDSADFSAQYKDSTGRSLPCYNLPRREVEILLTGYSVSLRAKVIDRLRELEEQQAKPAIPADYEGALLMALEVERQRKVLLLENEVMKPKADRYDALISSEGLYTTTQAASVLGYRSAQALNVVLRTLGWKHQNGDTATAYAIEQGYLTGRARIRADNGRSFAQMYITPKGIDAVKAINPAAAA